MAGSLVRGGRRALGSGRGGRRGQRHRRGDGYAVGTLDALGEGYGFRKIRRELGVTAFGINAIVMPPGYETGRHYHDEQEETYFVHRGTVEFEFGDGSTHVLGPGGIARVDAATVRKIKNVSDEDAVYRGGRRQGRLRRPRRADAAGRGALARERSAGSGMSFIVLRDRDRRRRPASSARWRGWRCPARTR